MQADLATDGGCRRRAPAALAAVLWSAAAALVAAATPPPDAEPVPVPDVALQIKVDTSRPQPYVGSGLGITAEFKNLSKRSVLFLSSDTTTLTLPPELEGPFQPIYGREAFFPSENDQWRANQAKPEPQRQAVLIAIQPGESYRAAWVFDAQADRLARAHAGPADAAASSPKRGKQAESPSQWTAWDEITAALRYLFFVPGDYKVLVQAKVGNGESPVNGGFRYHTFSETALIKVAAPQFVIMFGAMLGGLICLFLFPPHHAQTLTGALAANDRLAVVRAMLRWLNSVAGACLLSAIVTILLARLSESQFLVKINVNDFWGAIVVGFLAQYTGISILDRLLLARQQTRKDGQDAGTAHAKGSKGARPAADGGATPAP